MITRKQEEHLKCTAPANVNRIWTSEDSLGNFLGPGSAVWNIVYDGNQNGDNEVMGGGIKSGVFSDNLILRLHPYSNSSNIFEISGFAKNGFYIGLYTAGRGWGERRVLFTYHYDNSGWFNNDYGDKVRVINGWTGATIWDWEACHNTRCLWGHPTTIDIDNDGCSEVMFGINNDIMTRELCYMGIKWQTNVGRLCAATVAVGRAAGIDGVVVLSCDGRIKILSPYNGSILTTSPVYGNWISGPLVSDVNNDGNDDIVVAYRSGNITGPTLSCDPNICNGGCCQVCYANVTQSIKAINPLNWTSIWSIDKSFNGYYPASSYVDNYYCSNPPNLPDISQFAIGKILPNNQLGIAYLEYDIIGGKLTVIRADNGQTVVSGIGSYFGHPSVADLNGDGIEGVIVSDVCGNPKELSYVNGWTTPVWSAAGCADEPPITSDLIIANTLSNK